MTNYKTRTFYDVEHEGEVDEVLTPYIKAGAKIISQEFDYKSERLEITYSFDGSESAFEQKLNAEKQKLDSYIW
jgi:hypothetical protein